MKNFFLFLLISIMFAGCSDTTEKFSVEDSKISSQKIEKQKIDHLEIKKDLPKTPEGKLALCLKEKNVTVYGTSWCGHCKAQKKAFGEEAKEFLYFVDCDENPEKCNKEGIEGYPTWKFADGSVLMGTQQLEVLAKKSGCDYEK